MSAATEGFSAMIRVLDSWGVRVSGDEGARLRHSKAAPIRNAGGTGRRPRRGPRPRSCGRHAARACAVRARRLQRPARTSGRRSALGSRPVPARPAAPTPPRPTGRCAGQRVRIGGILAQFGQQAGGRCARQVVRTRAGGLRAGRSRTGRSRAGRSRAAGRPRRVGRRGPGHLRAQFHQHVLRPVRPAWRRRGSADGSPWTAANGSSRESRTPPGRARRHSAR